ncbi:hypothetical protein K491DRAFT_123413 [Lophiostoma macrostomum CBS 122681]|uniref:Uncharacterized protein n=1 Tax=Lophiostoma macrostomum CBS 122681 TaxID=1314788 RepID=A0A6A6TIV1_9PLEO|nr:hypothetical protein K491DRAFT_123413 [Lophiostoma macrostomum CBS 122681]
MVDLVMTAAYPYINKVRKVTLAGFVRKDSKEKWERLLRQSYLNVPNGYDADAELAAMYNIPMNDMSVKPLLSVLSKHHLTSPRRPPDCSCELSCFACAAGGQVLRGHVYDEDSESIADMDRILRGPVPDGLSRQSFLRMLKL